MWSEENSHSFIDYGDVFVPERSTQLNIFTQLLSSIHRLEKVVELCCGEGLLSEKILQEFGAAGVLGLDLSPAMLQKASTRLSMSGSRFQTRLFDLAKKDWRDFPGGVDAFVTSLAVHHLDEKGKLELFEDLYGALRPGGVFIMADIVQPTRKIGLQVAGDQWDDWVKRKGNAAAFEYFKKDGWNYYDNPEADPIDQPSSLFFLLEGLRAANFIDVDVFWMQAGHAVMAGWKNA